MSKQTEVPSQTLGQKRVRISFNPSEKTIVSDLKHLSARMIDTLETLRNSGRLLPDHERNEFNDLISVAQTQAEGAAMWAVKAATTQGLDL